MTRWIAALFVVTAALAFVAAQDDGEKPLRFPFGSSKSQLPFDVMEQDGEKVWRVTGRGNVRVEELVAGYTSATGKRVVYDASANNSSKQTVQYVGPDDGMIIDHDDLGNYVSELLEGARLTLVGHSTSKARVVQLDSAHGFATVIQPDDLAGLPETEWVTISWNNLGEAYQVGDQLAHFRSALVFVDGSDTNLTVTGRVAQLRNVNALVGNHLSNAIGSDGLQLKSYNLAGAVKAVDAQRVINELFETPSTSITRTDGDYRVTEQAERRVLVSIVSGHNRLLVRASPADHELVKTAIAAMQ